MNFEIGKFYESKKYWFTLAKSLEQAKELPTTKGDTELAAQVLVKFANQLMGEGIKYLSPKAMFMVVAQSEQSNQYVHILTDSGESGWLTLNPSNLFFRKIKKST